jgi:hypothetical protein
MVTTDRDATEDYQHLSRTPYFALPALYISVMHGILIGLLANNLAILTVDFEVVREYHSLTFQFFSWRLQTTGQLPLGRKCQPKHRVDYLSPVNRQTLP